MTPHGITGQSVGEASWQRAGLCLVPHLDVRLQRLLLEYVDHVLQRARALVLADHQGGAIDAAAYSSHGKAGGCEGSACSRGATPPLTSHGQAVGRPGLARGPGWRASAVEELVVVRLSEGSSDDHA